MKRQTVNDLRERATEALSAMLRNTAAVPFSTLSVQYVGGNYDEAGATLKFKFSDPSATAARAEDDFVRGARLVGLKRTLWGHVFTVRSKTYTVSGLVLRRKKFPVSATDAAGNTYKFPANFSAFRAFQLERSGLMTVGV